MRVEGFKQSNERPEDMPVKKFINDHQLTPLEEKETQLISNESIRSGFTLLENKIIDLNRQLEDRLYVQQLRLDNFAIEGLNFVQTLKALPNRYNIEYGPNNDYLLLLQNQKFINAIAIKLAMTDDAITNRTDLLIEIKELIKLIENELKL